MNRAIESLSSRLSRIRSERQEGHLGSRGAEKPRKEYCQKDRMINCVRCCEVKYEEGKVSNKLVIRGSLVTFTRVLFSSDGNGN